MFVSVYVRCVCVCVCFIGCVCVCMLCVCVSVGLCLYEEVFERVMNKDVMNKKKRSN